MKHVFPVIVVLLLAACVGAQAGEWAKYVAPNKSFSVHYPSGWTTTMEGSTLTAKNATSHEELQCAALQGGEQSTARKLAEGVVEALRAQMPDLTVQQWRGGEDGASAVWAHAGFTDNGQKELGDLLVVKLKSSAFLFAYSVPEVGYDTARASAILQGMVTSLAAGERSATPKIAIPALGSARMRGDAQAFLFILEFAIGAPLATTAEERIVSEFGAGWKTASADESAKYDQYPKLMRAVMSLKQDQVDAFREKVLESVKAAAQSNPDDPAIKALREQIEKGGKVVAVGPPALLDVDATAYSELLTYAALLQKCPNAQPEDLDAAAVKKMRGGFIKAWPSLSADERNQILSTPGIWIVVRTVLRIGTQEQQDTIRQQLKQLAAQAAAAAKTMSSSSQTATASTGGTSTSASSGKSGPTSSSGAQSASEIANKWATANLLQSMQQTTFNTYMWSRGFEGWTPMGKSW